MYCKHCGLKISDDSSYCKNCGSAVKERGAGSVRERKVMTYLGVMTYCPAEWEFGSDWFEGSYVFSDFSECRLVFFRSPYNSFLDNQMEGRVRSFLRSVDDRRREFQEFILDKVVEKGYSKTFPYFNADDDGILQKKNWEQITEHVRDIVFQYYGGKSFCELFYAENNTRYFMLNVDFYECRIMTGRFMNNF